MILVTSSHCGPCKMVKKVIETEKIAIEIKNVDDDPQFAIDRGIRSVPALILDDGSIENNMKKIIDIIKS